MRRGLVLSLGAFAVLIAAACGSFEAADDTASADAGGGADGGASDGGGPTEGGTGDAAADVRAPNERLVFVTSATFTGKLGANVQDIDAVCTVAADAAGLGGTWVAWVSTAASTALTRLTVGANNGAATWRKVDGTAVFASVAAFTQPLASPIDIDENGLPVPDEHVWTATHVQGTHDGPDCAAWTSGDETQAGSYGVTRSTGSTWTNDAEKSCEQRAHLYCFER